MLCLFTSYWIFLYKYCNLRIDNLCIKKSYWSKNNNNINKRTLVIGKQWICHHFIQINALCIYLLLRIFFLQCKAFHNNKWLEFSVFNKHLQSRTRGSENCYVSWNRENFSFSLCLFYLKGKILEGFHFSKVTQILAFF